VPGRGSVDYMLRTVQQQLVDLSGQADLKASIVMTTSAILTSVAAARLEHDSVRWSLVTFIGILLPALLFAVLAIVPTFRTHISPDRRVNPLFGDFGATSREAYVESMAEVMRTDGDVYRAIVNDIHASGPYLLGHKFRFLRYSYLFFLAAFLVAGLQQLLTELVR
jgi:Pycsar effector protein